MQSQYKKWKGSQWKWAVLEYFIVFNLHVPMKLKWIDTGRHCSPTPCIFILLRGEIIVFSSSAKANFSNPQALLSYILSFQLAVVKVLWKIFIFKTCQAGVILSSIFSTVVFQPLLYLYFSSFCVHICVLFLVYSVFYAMPMPILIICSTFLLPTLVFSQCYCLYCYLPEA